MKRIFLATLFLSIAFISFSRTVEPLEIISALYSKQDVILKNAGKTAISPFIVAVHTYKDGSQNRVFVKSEPILPGQTKTLSLPQGFLATTSPCGKEIYSPRNADHTTIIIIGCEKFGSHLTQEEGLERSFILFDNHLITSSSEAE